MRSGRWATGRVCLVWRALGSVPPHGGTSQGGLATMRAMSCRFGQLTPWMAASPALERSPGWAFQAGTQVLSKLFYETLLGCRWRGVLQPKGRHRGNEKAVSFLGASSMPGQGAWLAGKSAPRKPVSQDIGERRQNSGGVSCAQHIPPPVSAGNLVRVI